jgi:hypothetical protein
MALVDDDDVRDLDPISMTDDQSVETRPQPRTREITMLTALLQRQMFGKQKLLA